MPRLAKINKLNSDKFHMALAEMVALYGEKNWADIARALQQIYGYTIKNSTVAAKWQSINPKFTRQQFTYTEEQEFWEYALQNKVDMELVQKIYQERGQEFAKHVLWHRFRQIYKTSLSVIIRLVGRQMRQNHFKFHNLSDTTIRKMIELNFDDTQTEDPRYLAVRESCQLLMTLCTTVVMNPMSKRGDLQPLIIAQAKDKETFMRAIDDSIHLNLLQKIRFNTLNQGKSEIDEKIDNQSYSSDQDHFPEFYPSKRLKNSAKRMYKDPIEEKLTRKDIDKLKESVLYQRLFEDRCQQLYEWYNSAKISKTLDQQQFLFDPNHSENKQSQQMRLVKMDNQKIKTVRGRIRTNKKKFKNSMTIQFNYDEEEQEAQEAQEEQDIQLSDNNQNAGKILSILHKQQILLDQDQYIYILLFYVIV